MAQFITLGTALINVEDISRIQPVVQYDDDDLDKPNYWALEVWIRGHGLNSIRHRCGSPAELESLRAKILDHIRQHAGIWSFDE